MVNISSLARPRQVKLEHAHELITKNASMEELMTARQEGMSGSGIWAITNPYPLEGPHCSFILAGIYTEYRADQSVIVGTRISTVLDTIEKEFHLKD